MLDLQQLRVNLEQTQLAPVAEALLLCTGEVIAQIRHGDLARWQAACDRLPSLSGLTHHLDQDIVTVACNSLPAATRQQLSNALQDLCPWRKGPYSIGGIHIDTEWHSDWKWQRVAPHLDSLQDKRVLDVGCGNGYHLWRMLGAGAEVVVGIDPGLLFNMQFRALQHFIQHPRAALLPLKLEQMPALACFDSVFSMGVLYHRREPAEHLRELLDCLVPGGQLVLETLVVPADAGPLLRPENRYARMRNVWQIPSVPTLQQWLEKSGLVDIRVVSENRTGTGEQRRTPWMSFESLAESLDPDTPTLTVEGYPAPRRAVLLARKKYR